MKYTIITPDSTEDILHVNIKKALLSYVMDPGPGDTFYLSVSSDCEALAIWRNGAGNYLNTALAVLKNLRPMVNEKGVDAACRWARDTVTNMYESLEATKFDCAPHTAWDTNLMASKPVWVTMTLAQLQELAEKYHGV